MLTVTRTAIPPVSPNHTGMLRFAPAILYWAKAYAGMGVFHHLCIHCGHREAPRAPGPTPSTSLPRPESPTATSWERDASPLLCRRHSGSKPPPAKPLLPLGNSTRRNLEYLARKEELHTDKRHHELI